MGWDWVDVSQLLFFWKDPYIVGQKDRELYAVETRTFSPIGDWEENSLILVWFALYLPHHGGWKRGEWR